MKKYIIVIIVSVFTAVNLQAQKFITHEVKQGETIESIAKKYSITPKDLIQLNPDAKNGVKKYMILAIPNAKAQIDNRKPDLEKLEEAHETKELIGYKNHKTRRKETLYSISKKYNVEISEIKKHNTFLYSSNLRKGDKIRIPKFKTIKSSVAGTVLSDSTKLYEVKPKEGKWRVAYKFGLTVPELEALNPEMNETLQPGDKLVVPNIANNKEKPLEENFNYYTVQRAEGYMALERKLGLDKDSLVAMNPELEDGGLKLGMVLKVPGDLEIFESLTDVSKTNLVNRIHNFKPKKVALMLPYSLNKVDMDSVAAAKRSIKRNIFLSVSLDFQAGAMIALDSAKQLGISTHMKIFDTQNSDYGISKILNEEDFEDYDAVIGPLMVKNFDRMAKELRRHEVPAISPMNEIKDLESNVYQTVPSRKLLESTMINFAKRDSLANVLIISDSKHRAVSDKLKNAFPRAKQINSRKDEDGKEEFYIVLDDLENVFLEGKKNIVFLETDNEGFVSNVTSMVNGFNTPELEIMLMTTDMNNAFEGESVSNTHLSNLKFHYPSIRRSIDVEKTNGFVKRYKKEYGVVPNKYATRGFDLTMDLLLRLASGENLYGASGNDIETEYVENKFRYSKKMFGGFSNESVYIVKHDNLAIVQVE